MMPLLASMTDQTVAGMGPPGWDVSWVAGAEGNVWVMLGEECAEPDSHVGSRSLADRTRVVVRTMLVTQTLGRLLAV